MTAKHPMTSKHQELIFARRASQTLINYQALMGTQVIVVFDAHLVKEASTEEIIMVYGFFTRGGDR